MNLDSDRARLRRRKIPMTFPYLDGRKTLWLTREELQQKITRAEVYGRTLPRADLDAFDAHGMDLIEGRA